MPWHTLLPPPDPPRWYQFAARVELWWQMRRLRRQFRKAYKRWPNTVYLGVEAAPVADDGWRDERTGLVSGGLVASCSVCGYIRGDEPHECKSVQSA